MNYQEFKEQVDQFVCVPTKEQEEKFLMAQNSIHYIGKIGYIKDDGVVVKEPLHTDFDIFVNVLKILKKRGAVSGEDYIVTCYQKGLFIEIALHSTDYFLSNEDFVIYEQGSHDVQS